MLAAYFPYSMANNDDDRKDLDEVKRELAEIRGRPFDVDKILAENRAREERKRESAQKTKGKLEETVRAAREHRHALRAEELQAMSAQLEEKRLQFEKARREFAKSTEKKHGAETKRDKKVDHISPKPQKKVALEHAVKEEKKTDKPEAEEKKAPNTDRAED